MRTSVYESSSPPCSSPEQRRRKSSEQLVCRHRLLRLPSAMKPAALNQTGLSVSTTVTVPRPHLFLLLIYACLVIILTPRLLKTPLTRNAPLPNTSTYHAPHTYVAPHPFTPPRCHVLGFDSARKATWLHNSRAFCLTAAMCIRPNSRAALSHLYMASPGSSAHCSLLNADMSTAQRSVAAADCAKIRNKRVFCAHGRFAGSPHARRCPPVHSIASLSETDNASALHIPSDRVLVIVPAFPWLWNIYHFSFVGAHLFHILTDLDKLFAAWSRDAEEAGAVASPPRRVSVLFRGAPPAELGAWQASLTSILLRRVAAASYITDITLHDLHEDPTADAVIGKENEAPVLCARAAVLLGERGHFNLWPFPNGSAVSMSGNAVHVQAVALRRAVYEEFRITTRLPPLSTARDEPPRRSQRWWGRCVTRFFRHREAEMTGRAFATRFVFDVPPLVVGYARRGALADALLGQALARGWRRFSDTDERWFGSMLREEGRLAGAEVRELTVGSNTTMGQQVRWFAGLGLVVGIHGANLVNAMFAAPFGGLVEILPGGLNSPCYLAGGNAGLAYVQHEAAAVTRAESFCAEGQECWRSHVHKRVKINTLEHRAAVRNKVRKGLDRLVWLRKQFPKGIPAKLELPEQRYVIDWLRKERSA